MILSDITDASRGMCTQSPSRMRGTTGMTLTWGRFDSDRRTYSRGVPSAGPVSDLRGNLERSLLDARQHLGALDLMQAKLPLVVEVEVVAVE